MIGKAYYMTTLGDWKSNKNRFNISHWYPADDTVPLTDTSDIVVAIYADEGTHLNLEQDAAFDAMPSPHSTGPIGNKWGQKLAKHGVKASHTPFEVLQILKTKHPLLGHVVF